MELENLPSLEASCELGRVLAIQSELSGRSRSLGGRHFWRFFWRGHGRDRWQELPLSLTLFSLWERILWRWPAENVLKIQCDPEGIDIVYFTEDGYGGNNEKVSRARFDFEILKWRASKVLNWDWLKDGPVHRPNRPLSAKEQEFIGGPLPSVKRLSREQQTWLDETYGLGLPGFPFIWF